MLETLSEMTEHFKSLKTQTAFSSHEINFPKLKVALLVKNLQKSCIRLKNKQ